MGTRRDKASTAAFSKVERFASGAMEALHPGRWTRESVSCRKSNVQGAV